ncbi:MAG: hypothetical protein DMG25_19010 [Acidobacteria bacterium]|nr:MAG: hypothetical protein DMG25_19010 [Acidobacteriota bacterium]
MLSFELNVELPPFSQRHLERGSESAGTSTNEISEAVDAPTVRAGRPREHECARGVAEKSPELSGRLRPSKPPAVDL